MNRTGGGQHGAPLTSSKSSTSSRLRFAISSDRSTCSAWGTWCACVHLVIHSTSRASALYTRFWGCEFNKFSCLYVLYLVIINLDHVIILTAGADVRRCAAALRSTAAASAPQRPLSTVAASAPLRPLSLYCGRSPHYSGRSPHYCGRSPHYCGRSMSESDCVRSMFRSGVHYGPP